MAPSSEVEEILRLAADGIPRVAQVIAEIPTDNRKRAFDAAENSYRQTVGELGYEEDDSERLVASLMLRLRTEVVEQGIERLQSAARLELFAPSLRLCGRVTVSSQRLLYLQGFDPAAEDWRSDRAPIRRRAQTEAGAAR